MKEKETVETYLIARGYTKEQIQKIKKVKLTEEVLLAHIKDHYTYFSKFYKEEEIKKIILHHPKNLHYSSDTLDQRLKNFVKCKYAPLDVLKMVLTDSAVLDLSLENLQERLKKLVELKFYNEQEIRNMSILYPTLLRASSKGIERKFCFFASINLSEILIQNPYRLVPSVELTYARYQHITSLGVEIDIQNSFFLFQEETKFSKNFKIEKKPLLAKYPYESETKEHERTI